MSRTLDNMDFNDFLFVIRKYFKMIIILTLCAGIASFAISKFLITPEYEANAQILVNVIDLAKNYDDGSQNNNEAQLSQQLLNTYASVMTSSSVLNTVKSNLGLDLDIKKLSEAINVEAISETEVINLTVTYKSQHGAQQIANMIVTLSPTEMVKIAKDTSIHVISPAKAEKRPVSPNVLANTIFALFAGLILSCALAFILEMINNRIRSEKDIEKNLGVRVLGIIPVFDVTKK